MSHSAFQPPNQTEKLQALAQSFLVIASAKTLHDTLNAIAEQARLVIGAHQAAANLFSRAGSQADIAAVSFSDKYSVWKSASGNACCGNVFPALQDIKGPLRLTQEELENHPAWKKNENQISKIPPMRGWLAASLSAAGPASAGIIHLSDKYDGDFTEEDEYILAQFAQFASAALEKSRSEQALRESERRLTLLTNNLPALVSYLDKDVRFVFCNAEYTKWFGKETFEIAGKHLSEIIGTETFENRKEYIARALKGEEVSFEAPTRHHKLGWRSTAVTYVPDKTEGAVNGFYAMISDLTIRKKEEEAILFQSRVLDQVNDSVIAVDNEMRITYLNQAAERQYKVKASDVKGRLLSDVYSYKWILPGDAAAAANSLNRDGVWRGENLHGLPDGSFLSVESVVSVLKDTDGHRSGMLAVIRDVTSRKKAEEALRNSEQLYRAIGESIDYGIWICDAEGNNTYASESFLKLVGLSQKECSSTGWIKTLHPDDADATIAAWKECVQKGVFWEREHRFLGVDGQWHPILARGVPMKDGSGNILYWAGINLDISELKRTENEIRENSERMNIAQLAATESEERFRTMADNIAQFAWMADEKGWIFWYNKRWFEYTGTTLPEMEGWGWQKVHHPDHVQRIVDSFSSSVQSGKLWEDTFPLRGKDGVYRWFLSRAIPVRNEEGRIIRWFGTNTDITELKQTQEVLQAQKQELARSNQELEQFAYVSSHDLQEPLRTVTSFSELLELQHADRLDAEGRRAYTGYFPERAEGAQSHSRPAGVFPRPHNQAENCTHRYGNNPAAGDQ